MEKITSNKPLTSEWLERLQASGYRLTGPLQVIIGILVDSACALEPLELYDLGRKDYPRLGLVTVYRTLDKLEELGLVQRIHQHGGCNLYLRAAHGHEHILLCTNCGRVVYFSGDDLTALIHATAEKSGFAIQEHWLQLLGICQQCQDGRSA